MQAHVKSDYLICNNHNNHNHNLHHTHTYPVCFSAVSWTPADAFSPPYNGRISGIRLVHTRGNVTCNIDTPGTNWGGCAGLHVSLFLYRNGTTIQYYPTYNTNGITVDSFRYGIIHRFFIDGYNSSSPTLVMSQPSYDVKISDKFVLLYTEAEMGFTTHDNSGTSCADVYFIYSQVGK